MPEDHGTWVLAASANLDEDIDAIVQATRASDPVQGAWEVDGRLLGIKLPEDSEQAVALLDVVWSGVGQGRKPIDPEHPAFMPHVAIALTHYLHALRRLPNDYAPPTMCGYVPASWYERPNVSVIRLKG